MKVIMLKSDIFTETSGELMTPSGEGQNVQVFNRVQSP